MGGEGEGEEEEEESTGLLIMWEDLRCPVKEKEREGGGEEGAVWVGGWVGGLIEGKKELCWMGGGGEGVAGVRGWVGGKDEYKTAGARGWVGGWVGEKGRTG